MNHVIVCWFDMVVWMFGLCVQNKV